MEKMRKVIQNFLAVYMRVVTLVVFVSAVYIVVFWGWKTELDVTILWEILDTFQDRTGCQTRGGRN